MTNPAAHCDAAARPRRRKSRVPSERNRQVFVEVVIRGREQPEVARELGITQQRVSQIIEQFYSWLAENVPPQAAGMSAEEQLRLAANLTYLRLENAEAEAERNYRQSTEEIESVKIRYSAEGEELDRVVVYRSPRGKCSHLSAAIRAGKEKWAVAKMAVGLLSRGIEVEEHLAGGKNRQASEREATMPAQPKQQVMAGGTPAPRRASGGREAPGGARVPRPAANNRGADAPRSPARKVLCGSPPTSLARASLASTASATTGVHQPNCAPGSRRNFAGSALHARFFQPCAKALSGGNSDGSVQSPAVGPEPALVQVAPPNHDLVGGVANCSSPDLRRLNPES